MNHNLYFQMISKEIKLETEFPSSGKVIWMLYYSSEPLNDSIF